MKFKTNQRKARGLAFASLALASLSLLTGCASQDENPTGKSVVPGTAELSFRVAGINNSDAAMRSLPASETVNRVLDDGTVLSFTLAPDARSATKATSPMAANNTYEFVVLDGSNKIVGSVDALAGTASPVIGVDNTKAYTVAAYSYNNTSAMPSPGSVGSLATTVPGPANVDLLYATPVTLGANTLSSSSVNWQNLTFNHKYSQVKVKIDASQSNATVDAASFTLNVGSYATDLKLSDGTVTKQAAAVSTPVTMGFQPASLGGQTATSDPVVFFNNGETTTSAPFTLTVNSLTIGGITFPSGTNVPFTKALVPGVSYTLTVKASAQIPAGLTLAPDRYYFLASMISPNVQGTIPSGGVQVRIPYDNANAFAVTLPPFTSVPVTIPSSQLQGGGTVNLTLTWAQQTCNPGTGFILATLKPDAALNAKQLAFNDNGTNYMGYSLAKLQYPCKFGDKTATGASSIFTTYFVQEMAGIPDLKYGLPDNSALLTSEHNFIYLPVQDESWAGTTFWLSNNLGADYANVDKTGVFNPNQQATSATDFHAYGSLFQWGRLPDGHELIDWGNNKPVNGTSFTDIYNVLAPNDAPTALDNVGYKYFVTAPTTPYDWRSDNNNLRWHTGDNNPCPSGFHVPTEDGTATSDFAKLVSAAGITNSATAASSNLKFSVPGFRNYTNASGTLYNAGSYGSYWSSSLKGIYANNRYFNSGGTYTYDSYRVNGFSVRCLKD